MHIFLYELYFIGGFLMYDMTIEERCVAMAEHIIETKDTVRKTAKIFGVSKSTVHKDVAERLKKINRSLYNQAEEVLQKNKSERHIRGGMATKEKFLKLHNQVK